MGNFFLVCGVSGGGKTILTKRILEKNSDLGLIMLDVDEYYAKINGDERNRDNFFEVWIALWKDLHQYEIEGKNIILTTNSLTRSQRDQFIEWFPTYKHHCLWVMADKDKCFEGNKNRYRNVPEDKLEKMWQRMEFPSAKEDYWDSIAFITNWWTDTYTVFDIVGNIRTLLNI